MEHNLNGRQSSPGMLQTMTAIQPQFHDVTLACDDSRTMQTYQVMLVDISTVSGGFLRKHPHPYPLIYMKGGGSKSTNDTIGK